MFTSTYVAYTPRTHTDTINSLKERGYHAFKADASVVSSYQAALRRPLSRGAGRILYCNLDRALYWIKEYPEELKQLAVSPPITTIYS